MAITMSNLKKNMRTLEKRVDALCKAETFIDGAVEEKIDQLQTRSGSGKTAAPDPHNMSEGEFVDGTVKKPEKAMQSRSGSGAGVGDKFVGINQTGRHFNDGAVDKEEMVKCGCGASKKTAKKGKGKGPAKVAQRAKSAGVPTPKGGDASKKTSKKK
jgi:hypothetical protein